MKSTDLSEAVAAKLEHARHRANLVLILSGLACLLISLAVVLFIWIHPYAGPDLRNDFSLFYGPGIYARTGVSAYSKGEIRSLKAYAAEKKPPVRIGGSTVASLLGHSSNASKCVVKPFLGEESTVASQRSLGQH